MKNPEELERERASDIPEGAEVRADGSFTTPVEALSADEKVELLPDPDADKKAAEAAEEAALIREQAEADSVPREIGTPGAFGNQS